MNVGVSARSENAMIGVWTAAFVVAALLPSDLPILALGAVGVPVWAAAGAHAGRSDRDQDQDREGDQ